MLFLDGFDELANRVNFSNLPKMLSWLERLPKRDCLHVLLSARTTFFGSELDVGRLGANHTFRLLPFSEKMIAKFLDTNYKKSKDKVLSMFQLNSTLRDICKNPLHLSMLSSLINKNMTMSGAKNLIPDKSTLLYRNFIIRMIQDHAGISNAFPDSNSQFNLLSAISFDLYINSKVEFDEIYVREFIQRYSLHFDVPLALADALSIFKSIGIFLKIGSKFRFKHRSFQEALVAMYIVDEKNRLEARSWSVPYYAEIWDHIYALLPEDFWTQQNFLAFVANSNPVATVNIMCVGYRESRTEILPILLRQCSSDLPPTSRSVAVQGIGYFSPTRNILLTLEKIKSEEKNNIIRWQIYLTVKRWKKKFRANNIKELSALSNRKPPNPTKEEAMEIGFPIKFKQFVANPDMVTESFRRSMRQTNAYWNAYSTPVLVLGAMHDESSMDAIHTLVKRRKYAEITLAYSAIKSIVFA